MTYGTPTIGVDAPPVYAAKVNASLDALKATTDDHETRIDTLEAGGGGGGGGVGPDFPVSEYGAVGNGSDETAELQAALTAAGAAGGGQVTLQRGKKYGWVGTLTVPQGVTLAGHTTRQNLAPGASPTVPGLIALNANCQLRVGDWSGAAGPGGVSHLYVDGNFVGGATPSKKGLVRLAGVNLLVDNLFVSRSAGDGIVYDGVQNSTVVGGMSTYHVGSALVMDNGAGAISFLGGYYGSSKGGLLTCRDTAGETNMYPFGPTQNTWTGTIFEAYTAQPAPVAEPNDHIVHISGTQNHFVNCNFTGGASSSATATVLIDNTALTIIPTSVTFENCTFWVRQSCDAVRVVGNAWVTFVGLQNVSDDGTHHATAFVCCDGGSPHISMQGEVNMNGDTNGSSMFRVINSGTLNGLFSYTEGGRISRLRTGQVNGVRREGDVAHRGYIDRDFVHAWYDGTVSSPQAYIQRGNDGAGAGLDFYSAAGGEHKFIGAPVRVTDLYFGSSVTPFDPTAVSPLRYAPRESFTGPVSPETVTLATGATYDTTTYNQGYAIASNTLPAEWPVDCFGVMSIASNAWAAKTSLTATASVATYRFMCDGDKFGVFTYAAGFWMDVYIDGKPYSGNPVVPAVTTGSSPFGFQTFVLGSAKARLIEIRMIGGLVDVRTAKPYRIWKPTPGPNPSVAVVGDSYVLPTVLKDSGSGAVTTGAYLQGAYQRMAAELGISKMTSDGIGGTGYIAGGGGSTPYGLTARRTWLNTLNPDVIIVHGGGANDIFAAAATDAAIISAAVTYFTNIRADHPNAKLVFVEGFSPPGFTPAVYNPRYITIRAGVQSALAAAGIKAYFIDVATTHPPFEGAGYVTAPTGVGNNDIYVGSDTYHPSVRGHAYMRSFLAPKIARVLADNGALVGTLI